ncbi:PREDICTED: ABSCISIC ACID-INSENSITIVE 5-like protein 2 [Tarenaya hassleriana]|uniref:ABSCISIC ACID-INSENSITIVE 5-like protein 2 n=1 Tax=Tarenaya hassleriana TaxID=28532 RepID=UPI00053C974D|nr:PREDICTED: ABSCISIC ACID-INSENSITIVE 5-like protein 2 [Tarenaya hassleriana]
MVDLTMGSQGEVSGNVKNSQFEPLARQNSLYNLTLDEVQSQLGDLGKPLSSMNLDELLQNVWTAEANQSSETEPKSVINLGNHQNSSLQRQASLSLTGTLSKKTVDEVWRDIQRSNSSDENSPQVRQPTLGEITLEDFLVKAGVVSESPVEKENSGPVPGVDPNIASQFPQQQQWIQYSHPSYQQSQQGIMGGYMPKQSMMAQSVQVMDATRLDNPLMGTLSDTQMPGRKRGAPEEFIEKTVERRQKRMIKNRESAARSRARKQAYTNELENKVSRLEEENEKLRKQKELEKLLPETPVAEPKYQLRRTSSGPL